MSLSDQLKTRIPIALDTRGDPVYPSKEFVLTMAKIIDELTKRIEALEAKLP